MTLLLVTRLSERLNERSLVAIFQPLWTLPCIIALRFWPGVIDDAWGTYALITVLLSYPYCRMPAPFPPLRPPPTTDNNYVSP